jgi:hypothetical protein
LFQSGLEIFFAQNPVNKLLDFRLLAELEVLANVLVQLLVDVVEVSYQNFLFAFGFYFSLQLIFQPKQQFSVNNSLLFFLLDLFFSLINIRRNLQVIVDHFVEKLYCLRLLAQIHEIVPKVLRKLAARKTFVFDEIDESFYVKVLQARLKLFRLALLAFEEMFEKRKIVYVKIFLEYFAYFKLDPFFAHFFQLVFAHGF